MRPWIVFALAAVGCNLPVVGDPCTSDHDCGNYVCEVAPGATSGTCAEPATTGGTGPTTTTDTDDTGP